MEVEVSKFGSDILHKCLQKSTFSKSENIWTQGDCKLLSPVQALVWPSCEPSVPANFKNGFNRRSPERLKGCACNICCQTVFPSPNSTLIKTGMEIEILVKFRSAPPWGIRNNRIYWKEWNNARQNSHSKMRLFMSTTYFSSFIWPISHIVAYT